ncbi:MAG: FAD-binding protein [Myxococcota bacterium]|jgi:succinate dehydrogenase/fumarate reductase flavoprotein subunit|nr:FAD-binding protein [Myxococcota bacterium]
MDERVETDLLIVGSGFAGLWAAVSAREAGVERVAVVDKASIAMSSQSRLCAGATIYCLPEDDDDVWLRDIVEANGFLSRQPLVKEIVETSGERLRKLEQWGVQYPQAVGGEYLRLPSRGFQHVKMMVMPRYRDKVGGSAVIEALRRQAIRWGIARHPRLLVSDLLQRDGRVVGALTIDRSTAEPKLFAARAVLLATADCSFRGNYVCTDGTTGDGFRLAYDQGVRLSNMEFLCTNTGSPHFGFEGTGVALKWGGRLLDAQRESFMEKHHPDANAAEIHELVQAMAREARAGKGPPFYIEMGDAWANRIGPALRGIGGFMPLNLAKLEDAGIDLQEPQEWVPAVQSLRGGVRVGPDGQSDLPGLFAAGMTEALDPGLFNGWSTMRAMGSGERSGRGAAAYLRDAEPAEPREDEVAELAHQATLPLSTSATAALRPDEVIERMHRTIFRPDVSILKSSGSLEQALKEIEALRDEAGPELTAADEHELVKLHETRNMLLSAEMFLRASLARCESRGAHFREDHPVADNDHWLAWINLRRSNEGGMSLEREEVPIDRYPVQPRAETVPS